MCNYTNMSRPWEPVVEYLPPLVLAFYLRRRQGDAG